MCQSCQIQKIFSRIFFRTVYKRFNSRCNLGKNSNFFSGFFQGFNKPFQPEITNVADNFQLQATGVTRRTATLDYAWSNSGTQATVNHSTTTTAGSARLVIRDGANAAVDDSVLAPSLNEPTLTGASGNWKIQLVLSNYSGSLNFRVQKTP